MADTQEEDEDEKLLSFHEMGLDDRLLKAICKLGWSKPTLIQERAIPLSLQGKDVLARARTGSGKTGAYCVPLIQKILESKKTAKEQTIKAIILTPSKELCNQAYRNIQELTRNCSREVRCVDVSGLVKLDSQKPLLAEKPDIVVGTPSRLLSHIKAGSMTLKQSVEFIAIDEADLLLTLGYDKEVKELLGYLPKIYQAFLMSATLSEDVKSLKRVVLHNPVILKLEESQLPSNSQLTQYHIKCEEEEKFTLIYTLLKLKLIRGKTILFVNTVDRCYRLKLFLEHFGIQSCILNSELPVNSRCHIVSQFNTDVYDYIIASDETALENPSQTLEQKRSKRKKDKEYGVSRGIDFQNVANVVNFDFPGNVDAYIHRVGRTARADNKGTALSFVSMSEMTHLNEVEQTLSESHPEGETIFKPYQFKMDEIDGFRYRAKDAMRAVTRIAIREARLKEIKTEMLNSKKLKSYFEDNPRDLQILRHDKNLKTKMHEHMKNVPDYLVPTALKHLRFKSKKRKPIQQPGPSKGQRKFQKRKADPLKSFQFTGLRKAKRKKTK